MNTDKLKLFKSEEEVKHYARVNGYDEKDAILNATKIIKSKKEIYFHKLLNLYRSNLLHPNLKILLSDLKQEAKKRSDIENAASIYFEKAFQNLK